MLYNEDYDAIAKILEPNNDEIEKYMKEHNENYYCSREKLREEAYGGKPPQGFGSWGDFWKCGV